MPSSQVNQSILVRLIQEIVPESGHDEQLKEELVSRCQEVLSSRANQYRDSDISHLTELVKRHLSQHSHTSTSTLRFTHLLSRLLDQPILSRKHATVQFLYTLATSAPSSNVGSPFLPSLVPPRPTTRVTSNPTPPPDGIFQSKKPTGKSKAEILRKYRAKNGRLHLSEEALLRDALYILQGISGKYVKLVEGEGRDLESRLVFSDDPQYMISSPNRVLIHRLAELGHLYTNIATFVRQREGRDGVGMIEQSLCHYLESQLTEYYRLIAVLESQMHFARGDDGGRAGLDLSEQESGLTLKRLEVWIDDWRLRLRMMSACVEGCRDIRGGALVNLIHSYTEHGDPFVRKITDELLEEVSKPFFAMLHKWLFSGELYDPFSEFFVHIDPELANVQFVQPSSGQHNGGPSADEAIAGGNDGEYQGGLRLWESKYIFQKEMLPAFVGEDFGRKIFSTGKSLNFIRYNCHDSDWIATRERLGTTKSTLQYSDIVGLELSIDSAYSIVSQRLFDVFFEKFGLLRHLKALRNYMFLGYGDFADALMGSLGPHLSRSANTLFRHNLTAKLEEAIRSTNAQNDPPEVLSRLDAQVLEYAHGEIGWDVFQLVYKVDPPIDTVLDPDLMIKYLRVFGHLWKLKRVEDALTTGWMRVAGGARTVLRVKGLVTEWHKVRMTIAEMIHFVRQVQAYCHLEVIECQWKKLTDFIHKKEGGLDALIAAHKDYVEAVDRKIHLYLPKSGREENLVLKMRELFEIIIQFRSAMDDLYNYTLAEHARQESEQHDAGRGLYVDHRTKKSYEEARKALPRIQQRAHEYAVSFKDEVRSLVLSLSVHPDLDCKYLSIRLTFSDYYKIKRDKDGTLKA